MRRVKINYQVSGFSKFVVGVVIAEDEEFISVKSDLHGDVFRINRKCILEEITLNEGRGA